MPHRTASSVQRRYIYLNKIDKVEDLELELENPKSEEGEQNGKNLNSEQKLE